MNYVNLPVNFLAKSNIQRLSVETRLLAYYLQTAPCINRIGLYRLSLLEIVSQLRLDLYYVNVAIYNLEQTNFCRYDKIHEYIWICDFASWQEHHGTCELLLKNLPPLSFLNEFYRRYATLCYPPESACRATERVEILKYSYMGSRKNDQGGN